MLDPDSAIQRGANTFPSHIGVFEGHSCLARVCNFPGSQSLDQTPEETGAASLP